MKIAPTLEAVSAGKLIMPDLRKCPAAKAEFRALLAVARAAKRVRREWERWDEARPETCAALYRALARLDAPSRKGGK